MIRVPMILVGRTLTRRRRPLLASCDYFWYHSFGRTCSFSSSSSSPSSGQKNEKEQEIRSRMAGGEWRKEQLNKLENRFTDQHSSRIDSENLIQSDEDLQPMWKQMESRVANRRPRTLADTGGRTGRRNIKKTEEEMWLQEGLYDDHENENEKQG